MAVDNSYYGAGTYGQQTYNVYDVLPDPVTSSDTVGAPSAAFTATATPATLNDPETVGAPSGITAASTSPGSLADTDALGAPSASTATTATPGTLAEGETLGTPSASTASSVTPGSVVDTEAIGLPTSSTSITANPTSAADTQTIGSPTATLAATVAPASLADGVAVGSPTVALAGTAVPASINDPDGFGVPFSTKTYVFLDAPSLSDPETIGSPSASATNAVTPGGIADQDSLAAPSVTTSSTAVPSPVADAGTTGSPAVASVTGASPDELRNVETVGAPTATVALSVTPSITPDQDAVGAPVVSASTDTATTTLNDAESLGAPTAAYLMTVSPASITAAETIGQPILGANTTTAIYGPGDYGSGLYIGGTPASCAPAGIHDPEWIPAAEVNFSSDTSNYSYGDGAYGKGPLFGDVAGGPLTPNVTYGTGTYNLGNYTGVYVPGPDNAPLFPYEDPAVRVPLHVLGLGPWSPFALWRGAPNYGVPAGKYDAAPAMILPNAQSKGFTLRLDDGSEARADYSFTRNSAVIFEDMVTDLWWRRKDGITGTVDMIGRFNTSNVQVSADDTGLKVSAQFESYKSILGHKLVLDYKDRTNAESLWPKGTPLTDILRFAIPSNTNMDLSLIANATAYPLGNTTQPFTLPPGTLVSDLMTNLIAISPKPWEWWVETPDAFGSKPKLRFVVGERGANRDVTLFDTGPGSTNLAGWTLNGIADTYANALYYTGGTGGVYEVIDEQIEQYGERDAQDGNSSLGGDIVLIRNAAQKKLRELADHRPTFTVTLKAGFWRGRSHIDIGDTVHLRIKLGAELIAHDYRVTEIAVDIDGNGLETVRLTLGVPLAAADPRSKRSALVRIVRYLKNYSAPAGSDSSTGTTA